MENHSCNRDVWSGGVRVAVVGATGAVGRQLLAILQERKFPVKELVLFASPRSEGKAVSWNGRSYACQVLQKGCFHGVGIAFFDASDAISKDWVLEAAGAGAWVIDNSATFRLDEDIFLVVPEVNGLDLEAKIKAQLLQKIQARDRILAGPNCVAVPLAVALKPIQKKWGLKRVVVSTYQSTSGAGHLAMAELSHQSRQTLDQKPVVPDVFPHPIAFNCIPHIGSFKDDGMTSEEHKVIAETRKLIGLPQLKISVTAVRVPTFLCHSESVNIECEQPFTLEEVRQCLLEGPGLILLDDPLRSVYPLSVTSAENGVESASGKDAVYVGRLRRDPSLENSINLWIVADNLRKGAALNAVQMGELLLKMLA